MQKETYTIDAKGIALGRVATKAAVLLMGKNKPDFERNKVAPVSVTIVNAGQVSISSKKAAIKRYKSYSGYPGGLKETSVNRMIEKKGFKEIFKKTVFGMLPKNKLRSKMILNLKVTE